MIRRDITFTREDIRQRLYALTDVIARSEGFYNNVWYRNEYRTGDLQIVHSYEAPDLTDATETFKLDKPLLILYVTDQVVESGTVDTRSFTVEFQIAVNYNPDGVVKLLGYIELLRVIVNPRDKGYWMPIGLAPRRSTTGSIINGGEIKQSLKDRLLVQSLLCEFTYIGE